MLLCSSSSSSSVLVLLLFAGTSTWAFTNTFQAQRQFPKHRSSSVRLEAKGFGNTNMSPVPNTKGFNPAQPTFEKIEPVFEDMEVLAMLLANITEVLDVAPEKAMTLVSKDMGWLFARDVPKLAQMLLNELPSVRQDNQMMRAYMFLMDFLEAVGKETAVMLKKNQANLRKLMDAAKVSEQALDQHIKANKQELLNADFSVYMDSEIQNQDTNSPMENLLVTIKLRLLDEQGQNMGVDVMLLPKLASEEDPVELRRKTVEHLEMYDQAGRQLFLQTLQLMRGEMEKRYNNVDPILFMNLGEVEKIAVSMIKRKGKD